MTTSKNKISRREALKLMGLGAGAMSLGAWTLGCFEGDTLKHFDLGMAGILYVRDLSN